MNSDEYVKVLALRVNDEDAFHRWLKQCIPYPIKTDWGDTGLVCTVWTLPENVDALTDAAWCIDSKIAHHFEFIKPKTSAPWYKVARVMDYDNVLWEKWVAARRYPLRQGEESSPKLHVLCTILTFMDALRSDLKALDASVGSTMGYYYEDGSFHFMEEGGRGRYGCLMRETDAPPPKDKERSEPTSWDKDFEKLTAEDTFRLTVLDSMGILVRGTVISEKACRWCVEGTAKIYAAPCGCATFCERCFLKYKGTDAADFCPTCLKNVKLFEELEFPSTQSEFMFSLDSDTE